MNVLGWMKSNWIIVVCVAIMLIAPPIAWYFSTSMAKKTGAARQTEADRLFKDVRNLQTTYALPSVRPDAERVDFTFAPNERVIQWFREQNQQLTSAMQQVVQEAVEFNRRGREPVADSVLPAPPEDRTQRQTVLIEFANAFVPSSGQPGQSVYERMLADLNAGGPVSAVQVAQTLRNEADREIQRRQSGAADGQIAPEEEEEIRNRLVQMRLGRYRTRAREISLYADLSAFPDKPEQSPWYPHSPVSGVPPVEQCFRWQWDAWLADDLLAAIKTANSDESGRLLPVEEAPVKRLLMMRGPAPRMAPGQEQGTSRFGFGEPVNTTVDAGPDPATGLIEPSFDAHLTGRPPDALNQLYDVRQAAVLLHVDSSRLPQVIEAFGRTNFITVTDVTVSRVDLDGELGRGFFYGNDHVVQAQLTVEILYLRQWTTQFMPPSIRASLGLPESDPEPEAGGDG
jgi:hypothetical protein